MAYEYYRSGETGQDIEFTFTNPYTKEETTFDYEVPFDTLMEVITKHLSDMYNVNIDGMNNDVFNLLGYLGELVGGDIIDALVDEDDVQQELKERLKEDAEEKFNEICKENHEDDLEFEKDTEEEEER